MTYRQFDISRFIVSMIFVQNIFYSLRKGYNDGNYKVNDYTNFICGIKVYTSINYFHSYCNESFVVAITMK